MAKFQFRVYDPKARKVRKGQIDSLDLKTARKQLVARGLQVQSLTPKVEVRERKVPDWSTARPTGQPLIYRPSLVDRMAQVDFSSNLSKVLLGVLTVLGCLIFYSEWSGLRGNQPKDDPRKDVKVEIRGQLSPVLPADAVIEVRFPEIPYSRKSRHGDVLDGASTFVLKATFVSTRVPSYCDVKITSDGYKPVVVKRVRLVGTPLSADMGVLRLTKNP